MRHNKSLLRHPKSYHLYKENSAGAKPSGDGGSLSCTYASDDEDTVFARVKPSCSTVFARISILAVFNETLYFLISIKKGLSQNRNLISILRRLLSL